MIRRLKMSLPVLLTLLLVGCGSSEAPPLKELTAEEKAAFEREEQAVEDAERQKSKADQAAAKKSKKK